MPKIYMAGDPHNQNDDYTIEKKESKTPPAHNTSPYNATEQYQSAAKQQRGQERSQYGLKNNPIKTHAKKRPGRMVERDMGYGRC